jgi:hypothetical protein
MGTITHWHQNRISAFWRPFMAPPQVGLSSSTVDICGMVQRCSRLSTAVPVRELRSGHDRPVLVLGTGQSDRFGSSRSRIRPAPRRAVTRDAVDGKQKGVRPEKAQGYDFTVEIRTNECPRVFRNGSATGRVAHSPRPQSTPHDQKTGPAGATIPSRRRFRPGCS